jgi:5'-methylthioadenosine phosphorylase
LAECRIGFIGGSGLYDVEGLDNPRHVQVDTPFGEPSDSITLGTIGSAEVAFLPRHGKGHRFSPTEIPARANIYALKSLGVGRIVGLSAVGSLKEELRPLDLVIPDQIIDRTKGRPATFFGDGVVAHVGFADPFCPELSSVAYRAADSEGVKAHQGGAYLVMEGPQFSTRAESAMYRSWGASVIGMTALPEAKLAREAEICYTTMAFVTDYDVWRDGEDEVSVDMIVANLMRNAGVAQRIIARIAAEVPGRRGCACGYALKDAIITDPDSIPAEAKMRLGILVENYLPN